MYKCDLLRNLQLDINTVAAGGGSQLFFRAGMFVVGPESAGAHPGPVCYKKGKHEQKNQLCYVHAQFLSVWSPEGPYTTCLM